MKRILGIVAVMFIVIGAAAQEDTLNQVDDWCETGVKIEPVETVTTTETPVGGVPAGGGVMAGGGNLGWVLMVVGGLLLGLAVFTDGREYS